MRQSAIQCDNCKATGSRQGIYVQWADGTKRLKRDVRSYFTLSKSRYEADTEPFADLHFCTLECVVEYAPKLLDLSVENV